MQSSSNAYLEQQLILHDPLNRFDEQIVQLQPVTQLLPEILPASKVFVSKNNVLCIKLTTEQQFTHLEKGLDELRDNVL